MEDYQRETLEKWERIWDLIEEVKKQITEVCGYCFKFKFLEGSASLDCCRCPLAEESKKICDMREGRTGLTLYDKVVSASNRFQIRVEDMLDALRNEIGAETL